MTTIFHIIEQLNYINKKRVIKNVRYIFVFFFSENCFCKNSIALLYDISQLFGVGFRKIN